MNIDTQLQKVIDHDGMELIESSYAKASQRYPVEMAIYGEGETGTIKINGEDLPIVTETECDQNSFYWRKLKH